MNAAYLYVLVRKDLTPEQVAVQASHAAFDAGKHFGQGVDPYLVLCALEGPDDLDAAYRALCEADLPLCRFFEPDNDTGYSAIACLATTKAQREAFRRFPLYRADAR